MARLATALAVLAVTSPAFAGVAVNSLAFVSVPALDDLGLAGLMVLIGVAGGIATRIRRRK